MARKTKAQKEADARTALEKEAKAAREAEAPKTRAVKKAIENPLRLNNHIVLSDYKEFNIPGPLLKDEMFMTHIEYLISLNKLERV